MRREQGGPESKEIFGEQAGPPRHYWTMVCGQEWKILLLLGLKIAQGSSVRKFNHQEGGLGTELHGQIFRPKPQAVQLGYRGGILRLALIPLGSPSPIPISACHRIRW